MAMLLGRIGFIGAGRLAQTLAMAVAQAGETVTAVNSRRLSSAHALAHRVSHLGAVDVHADAQSVADLCDTVFITVTDDQIAAVCRSLTWRSGQRVVHCSGATELTSLEPAAVAGAHVAGFHPLHTFGDVDTALAGLPGCAVAVESVDEATRLALMALAVAIGARPFELPPGSRALYHASAHYAGSLVVTLMDEAVRHWERFGVEPQQALQALLPLLRSTVRAMESRGLGPGMAGVVARGDSKTLEGHLQAMAQAGPEALQLYALLTERSVPVALQAQRIHEVQASDLRAVLHKAVAGGLACHST